MVVGAPIGALHRQPSGALRRQPSGAFMINLYLVSGTLATHTSRILSSVDFVVDNF